MFSTVGPNPNALPVSLSPARLTESPPQNRLQFSGIGFKTLFNSAETQQVNLKLLPRLRQSLHSWGQTLQNPSLTRFLAWLDGKPLALLLFKDITCFNAPKLLLIRSLQEFMDKAPLEISNTAITFFSSLTLPRLLRPLVSKISKVPTAELKREITNLNINSSDPATKMARLAVSFGFFWPFALAFSAAPYLRNWLTLKRDPASHNFQNRIGYQTNAAPTEPIDVKAEKAYQLRYARNILGLGVALGAASLLGFGLVARGLNPAKPVLKNLAHKLENQWKKPFEWFFKRFDLKGEGAYQIAGGPATFIFWGLPAYIGWIMATRDHHERREMCLQAANSIFWFFFAGKMTNILWRKPLLKIAGNPRLWEEKFLNTLTDKKSDWGKELASNITGLKYSDILTHFKGNKKELIRFKNWQFGISGLGIPIGSLGAVQAVNFHTTQVKLDSEKNHLPKSPVNKQSAVTAKKTGLENTPQPSPPSPDVSLPSPAFKALPETSWPVMGPVSKVSLMPPFSTQSFTLPAQPVFAPPRSFGPPSPQAPQLRPVLNRIPIQIQRPVTSNNHNFEKALPY